MSAFQVFTIRRANEADLDNISALQAASLRALAQDYEPSEIQSFLDHVAIMDRDALLAGRYSVAEYEGEIIACGGWTAGATTYDHLRKNPSPMDDAGGAATLFGLYADPAFARTGIAGKLLSHIEIQARRVGHRRVKVTTPYSGMPFFTRMGYRPMNLVSLELPGGQVFHGAEFSKPLDLRLVSGLAAAA